MFSVPASPWQAKGATKEQTNKGVWVGCWMILYNSPTNIKITAKFLTRAVKWLISLITLITWLIYFNRALIVVLSHTLFVTFFNLFVFHLQVDVVSPLLLNASLLLAIFFSYACHEPQLVRSATKQHLHPQSVAEISRHSALTGDRIRQCGTSSGTRHKEQDKAIVTMAY